MLAYAFTIFSSAFLLFQVQPLIGKYILPWFGGTPGVWTACMLFFQLVLLAGYAYAHLSTQRLSVRNQVRVHLILLAGAIVLLPITPADSWKPQGSDMPVWRILTLLVASIGLPYFVLSSTSPLLQAWFQRIQPGRSPYRLYALSNIGSLLALLSYPFWFEIHLTRKMQTVLWSWGMGLFAMLCGYCAIQLWRKQRNRVEETKIEEEEVQISVAQDSIVAESAVAGSGELEAAQGGGTAILAMESPPPAPEKPRMGHWIQWLGFPAVASVILLAVTNKLCQDMAVTPFLWVLPLSLYLLTFILCFDHPRWYSRVAFGFALLPCLMAVNWAFAEGVNASIYKQVAVYASTLFVCCMTCHGELYRLKPAPKYLTGYFLMIALGGALGGFFVAVMGPMLFRSYVELQWGLGACLFLFLLRCGMDRKGTTVAGWVMFALLLAVLSSYGLERGAKWLLNWLPGHNPVTRIDWTKVQPYHWFFCAGPALAAFSFWLWFRRRSRPFPWHAVSCLMFGVAAICLMTFMVRETYKSLESAISVNRNFYGVLTVWKYNEDGEYGDYLLLQHGQITHGLQFIDGAGATMPTSYYTESSGIGQAMGKMHKEKRNVGVVGLGTGSLAVYGRTGDRFRFYEINPEIERIATHQFSYISNCPAQVEIALGDARLCMEREASQQFDLLALDAFSSDAIPAHLLTREAFEIYLKHLKPTGILAVHISNRFLNLEPVVDKLARVYKLESVKVSHEDTYEWWQYESTWVLLARGEGHEVLSKIENTSELESKYKDREIPLWTDDYSSLYPLLQ